MKGRAFHLHPCHAHRSITDVEEAEGARQRQVRGQGAGEGVLRQGQLLEVGGKLPCGGNGAGEGVVPQLRTGGWDWKQEVVSGI